MWQLKFFQSEIRGQNRDQSFNVVVRLWLQTTHDHISIYSQRIEKKHRISISSTKWFQNPNLHKRIHSCQQNFFTIDNSRKVIQGHIVKRNFSYEVVFLHFCNQYENTWLPGIAYYLKNLFLIVTELKIVTSIHYPCTFTKKSHLLCQNEAKLDIDDGRRFG